MATRSHTRQYGIADLRKEFGITARTLRHYEDCGLLAPRRVGNRRIYNPADRTRLRLALRGRRIGLSLAECQEIIDMYRAPTDERQQIAALVHKIDAREKELLRRRRDLNFTLRELRRVRAAALSGIDPDPAGGVS